MCGGEVAGHSLRWTQGHAGHSQRKEIHDATLRRRWTKQGDTRQGARLDADHVARLGYTSLLSTVSLYSALHWWVDLVWWVEIAANAIIVLALDIRVWCDMYGG